MPPERRTCSNAQGRQKSCAECARAKRRCDLTQPICLRCNRLGLPCIYPPQPSNGATPVSNTQSTPSKVLVDDDFFQFDVRPLPEQPDVHLLDFGFTAGFDAVDALNSTLYDSGFPGQDCEHELSVMSPFHLPGKAWNESNFSPFIRARLSFTFEHMKRIPTMMVNENRTPWCHRFLYDEHMPRSLQDAHAACALYITQNGTNAHFVARHIVDRVAELVEGPPPANNTDFLARVHALMLYLVIFAFGGDFRYGPYRDAVTLQLDESGQRLYNLLKDELDPEGQIQLYPSTAARAAWKAFIFRESARRTLLSLFQLLVICRLMSGQYKDCKDTAYDSRVSFSAPLWNAESAFDWALTWNEKNHLDVVDLDYSGLLDTARPNDIDLFGKMLLTSMVGIDELKGWFHTRGGIL